MQPESDQKSAFQGLYHGAYEAFGKAPSSGLGKVVLHGPTSALAAHSNNGCIIDVAVPELQPSFFTLYFSISCCKRTVIVVG
jgi:hypothetical protein